MDRQKGGIKQEGRKNTDEVMIDLKKAAFKKNGEFLKIFI